MLGSQNLSANSLIFFEKPINLGSLMGSNDRNWTELCDSWSDHLDPSFEGRKDPISLDLKLISSERSGLKLGLGFGFGALSISLSLFGELVGI